ncbi:hypothetical protein RND59_19270 [Vibrio ruber]|nr:hypothetical protein [Vibrio ruber]WNJ97345.1 hypothetical protein RND59_19270 [Vibrio ruber]
MEELTIQAFIRGEWIDIGIISFPKSSQHNFRVTELNYLSDYALEHHDKDDFHAVSLNHPVSFFFDDMGKPGWLTFLDDIMPSGASRRYWVKHLDIEDLSSDEQDYVLLKFGTMSPIGNLRIKDSLPERYEVADTLSDLVPKEVLLQELEVTASKCIDLKQRLALRGVPEQILEMPAVGLNYISEKLTKWGLL